MHIVSRIKEYNIYEVGNEYIIHNAKKEFSEGHTHIRNLGTAEFIVKLAIHKSMPHHMLPYFIESLARITTDEVYKEKLLNLLEVKNSRGKKTYANRGNYNCKNKKS